MTGVLLYFFSFFQFHAAGKVPRPSGKLPSLFSEYLPEEMAICSIAFGNDHLKGQLQRFHKLISNDRIWPSNTASKLFLKNLFSFSRYRPSKSGTSAGSILGFTRFPKIIIGKPSFVTSQVIKLPDQCRARAAKQMETAKFDSFWKKLWFTLLLMTA